MKNYIIYVLVSIIVIISAQYLAAQGYITELEHDFPMYADTTASGDAYTIYYDGYWMWRTMAFIGALTGAIFVPIMLFYMGKNEKKANSCLKYLYFGVGLLIISMIFIRFYCVPLFIP